jgi:plastocyanin
MAMLASVGAVAGPAAAGDIHGTARFNGPVEQLDPLSVTKDNGACGTALPDEALLVANGNLANVVVTLQGSPGAAPGKVTLDQQGCRFVPRVQVAPLGSTLEILNSDAVLHGVHGWLGRSTRFNIPMPAKGARASARLDRAGLIQVRCDVHGWMRAYLIVADGPAAVAGPDGAFTLRDVRPGTYTLTAWHERLGEKTAQVTVPAQGAAHVNFTFGG